MKNCLQIFTLSDNIAIFSIVIISRIMLVTVYYRQSVSLLAERETCWPNKFAAAVTSNYYL